MSQENVQSPVAEGDIIAGKYRVERVLGVGGMGVVVAARHVELGELFALKFLLANFRENAEVSARFAREARTGIRVKNEHVARVFDVGTLPDGAPYMVMEHLTGEDLAVVIERRGRLPLHETVDLLLQACEALCEAHQLGVVHRDLKPANLFIIAGSDGLPFVKVLDFGISKLITSGVEDLSATSSAAVLGSPLYMSPEQLASSKDVDQRADIWSLGVILYEALTGRPPFLGDSFVVLTAGILGGKFEPIARVRPDLPRAIDGLIASMLTVDRAKRLPSVAAFARQLAPFGTAAAQTSSDRIARITARQSITSEASEPNASKPSLDLADTKELVAEQDLAAVASSPEKVPRSGDGSPADGRRWRVIAGAGLAATALVAAALVALAAALRAAAPSGSSPAVVASGVVPVVVAVTSSVPAATQAPGATAPSAASAAAPASAASVEQGAQPAEVRHDLPPIASAHPTRPAGGSGAEALTRAFARREADVARCFDAHAADLQGAPQLAIRFTVDVDGHVKAAQISPPEVAPTPLGACLADVARGTQFGRQTQEVSFRIPIVARRGS